jgi:hypothetical protein
MPSITFSDNEEKVMTIAVLTILAVTGSLVVLKPGVMVLVRHIIANGGVFRPVAISNAR